MLRDKQRKIRMRCQISKRKSRLSRNLWKSLKLRTSRMKTQKSKLNRTKRRWRSYKNEFLDLKVSWHKLRKSSTLKRRRIVRWEIIRTVMVPSQVRTVNSPKWSKSWWIGLSSSSQRTKTSHHHKTVLPKRHTALIDTLLGEEESHIMRMGTQLSLQSWNVMEALKLTLVDERSHESTHSLRRLERWLDSTCTEKKQNCSNYSRYLGNDLGIGVIFR